MEYVYAALLLHKLKQNITEDSVKNVVQAAGVSPDEVRVKALVAALGEVNIEEALKAAPVAVAGASISAGGGAASSAGAAPEQPRKKKRRKKRRTMKLSKACRRSLVRHSLPSFLKFLLFCRVTVNLQ